MIRRARAVLWSLPAFAVAGCGADRGTPDAGAAAATTVDATQAESASPVTDDASLSDDVTLDDASPDDAATGDADGGVDGGACLSGNPYDLTKCSYFVDLPCGASYPQEQCHLLLSDCGNICANGFVTCEYTASACDLDSGALVAPAASPVTVQCNTSTSKICPP